jgi:NAD(P)-dependent dehydrogenase (short-subunit alcohol dehydrogenase family)
VEIEGRVALIVGGASGMARATAQAIVDRGGKIAILDLPSSKGAEAAAELGNGSTFHPCDVTDFDGFEAVVAEAVEAHGGIQIALNTAGVGIGERTVGKSGPHSLETFRKSIDLNLIGTFNFSRLVAWHMSKNEPDEGGERGVIINTSSAAAFEGQIGQVAYTAAKAAISGMTLVMARDLGALGIRTMAIAPSLFLTGLSQGITPEMEALLTKDAAFPKRMGTPVEYANVAIAIIETPMLNGSTIRLDGGVRFAPK